MNSRQFYKTNKQSYLFLNQYGGGELTPSQHLLIPELLRIKIAASNRNDHSFPNISEDYLNRIRDYVVDEENWKRVNKRNIIQQHGVEAVKERSKVISNRLTELQDDQVNWEIIKKLTKVFTENIPVDASNWLITKYIDGGIARLEDIESRAKPSIKKLNELREKRSGLQNNNIGTFNSLPDLEEFLERNAEIIEDINIENNPGINDKEIIYDGEMITIIKPTTKEGSCYYGKKTKWCTATPTDRNMYNSYTSYGPLYIIQPKNPENNGKEKYQLQFETEQYMDENDMKVDLKYLVAIYPEIIHVIDDDEAMPSFEFTKIIKRYVPDYIPRTISVKFNKNEEIFDKFGTSIFYDNIEDITFGDDFDKPIMNENGVSAFSSSVKSITFGKNFDQPIMNNKGESAFSSGVKSITFGKRFNQPIMNDKGESAFPSTVESITFGRDFKYPIRNKNGVRAFPAGASVQRAFDVKEMFRFVERGDDYRSQYRDDFN